MNLIYGSWRGVHWKLLINISFADTLLCSPHTVTLQCIVMLRALLPLGTSRLACLASSPLPLPTLVATSLGHQAELRRTFSNDGSFSRGGSSQLSPSFLHHSSPSLMHWRGKRSFERRREAAVKMVRGGYVGTRPWQPEEDQVRS